MQLAAVAVLHSPLLYGLEVDGVQRIHQNLQHSLAVVEQASKVTGKDSSKTALVIDL